MVEKLERPDIVLLVVAVVLDEPHVDAAVEGVLALLQSMPAFGV